MGTELAAIISIGVVLCAVLIFVYRYLDDGQPTTVVGGNTMNFYVEMTSGQLRSIAQKAADEYAEMGQAYRGDVSFLESIISDLSGAEVAGDDAKVMVSREVLRQTVVKE